MQAFNLTRLNFHSPSLYFLPIFFYTSFQSTNPFPLSSSSMGSYDPLEINDVIKLVKNVVNACLLVVFLVSLR